MLGNQSRIASWGSTILENYVDIESLPWLWKETRSPALFFLHYARQWMSFILLGTDLFSFLVAVLIASSIAVKPSVAVSTGHNGIILVLVVMMTVLFCRKGLYPTVGMHYADELRHVVTSSLVAFLSIIAISVVFQVAGLVPILMLAGGFNLLFIPAGRYFVRRLLIQWGLWGEPVVIISDSERAQALVKYFQINMQFGLRPVAVLSDPIMVAPRQWMCPSLTVCRLKLFARNSSLKTALVLVDDLNDIDRMVERYRFVFERVILIKEQDGKFGLSSLQSLDFMNLLGLQVKNDLMDVSSQVSKRIVDVFASFLAIVLLSPLLVLIALLIKLDTGGRVFYRQLRIGKNGKSFTLVKFRTMHLGADQVLKDALSRDPELKKEWDSFQKLKKDPRITRVGKWLRRFSLDELPQLYNIVRGEMSIVGPRPIMLNQRKLYGEAIKLYIRVAPGITGLWQVSGRNETTFSQRAALDVEYIQRWSYWLDIYILFKTIKVVFWQKGAY